MYSDRGLRKCDTAAGVISPASTSASEPSELFYVKRKNHLFDCTTAASTSDSEDAAADSEGGRRCFSLSEVDTGTCSCCCDNTGGGRRSHCASYECVDSSDSDA